VAAAATGRPAGVRSAGVWSTGPAATAGICASPAQPALAARLSRDIPGALRGRSSAAAVTVLDRRTGVACALAANRRYDSASVVKVTILAALLRKHMEKHTYLSQTEVNLATAMITRSDDNAASALWSRVGRASLRHFLALAKMTETVLGPGGYWGLTQITARDELTLLKLLTSGNSVRRDRARQERLAAARHARLAHQQRRQLLRQGARLHDRGAQRRQPDHGLRSHHRAARRRGHPP
jgi:beta-lactamase class A